MLSNNFDLQMYKLLKLILKRVQWCMQVKELKKRHFIIGLVVLLFTLIYTFYFTSIYETKRKEILVKREQPDTVILLTMIRSGSSILGSIFNERTNVTYLYEPLYPFGLTGLECNENFTKDDISAVLRFIAKCDFENILPYYRRSKRTNEYAK